MGPLRISGTTSRLDCSRQLRRCVAQLGPTIVVKPGGGMNMWKRPLLPSGNARHAVHHALQEADKTSEVYRLANQFRRENADVVGDKPVKNDAGEMSMSKDSKQKAWLQHNQRLLSVEFDWDPDHLSYQWKAHPSQSPLIWLRRLSHR